MNRRHAFLALPIVAGLIALAFAVPAISFPTQTQYCSNCHGGSGATISVGQVSATDSTITYSVSGTPTGGWAVFDPAGTKLFSDLGAGQFSLPRDGRTYRVFWASKSGMVSASQNVTPSAPPPPPPTTVTTAPPPPPTTVTTAPPPPTTVTTAPPPPTTVTTAPPPTTDPTIHDWDSLDDELEDSDELEESDDHEELETSDDQSETDELEDPADLSENKDRHEWDRHEHSKDDSKGRRHSSESSFSHRHSCAEFGGAQAWTGPYKVSLREDQGRINLFTTISNTGSEPMEAWATFTVRDRSGRPVFQGDSDHVDLAPGAATTVSVPAALTSIGRYTGSVSLASSGGGDTRTAPFRFNVSW